MKIVKTTNKKGHIEGNADVLGLTSMGVQVIDVLRSAEPCSHVESQLSRRAAEVLAAAVKQAKAKLSDINDELAKPCLGIETLTITMDDALGCFDEAGNFKAKDDVEQKMQQFDVKTELEKIDSLVGAQRIAAYMNNNDSNDHHRLQAMSTALPTWISAYRTNKLLTPLLAVSSTSRDPAKHLSAAEEYLPSFQTFCQEFKAFDKAQSSRGNEFHALFSKVQERVQFS